jgi:hypothetical protein
VGCCSAKQGGAYSSAQAFGVLCMYMSLQSRFKDVKEHSLLVLQAW